MILLLLTTAGTARADAIDPDMVRPVCAPLGCAPGSYGVGGGHSGCPYACSVPTACDEATPCSAGSLCEPDPVSLCVERMNGGNYEFDAVQGACVDGACPEGQTCWSHRRCVPDPSYVAPPRPAPPPGSAPAPAPAAPAPATSSSGCSVSRTAGAPLWAAGLLALVCLRRRRSTTGRTARC